MQSNDPNEYKANPDFMLSFASHLGVTSILSDQPLSVIKRVERVLQKIWIEVNSGRIEAPECLEAIGAQLAIVQGQPPTIEELLWAHSTVCTAWRKRGHADDYSPTDTSQRALLEECEAIMREVRNSCEERIEKARHALGALDQASVRVADLGGIIDRRPLQQGHRIFISYAHEDKRIAQFIECRLRKGGISTWLDDRSLAGGSVFPPEIAENIQNCSHFCVIISPNSKDNRWVAQESNWALTFLVKHGAPQIIPILHNENNPPAKLADRRAISFDDWNVGMSELWTAIGVPNRDRWSLSEIGKLLRRGKKLLEAVEWCSQADSFMTVHEETFEALEESESYLRDLAVHRQGYELVRFARTSEIHSNDSAYATYSEDFYKFANSYVGGTVLLRDMANLIEEVLASIPQWEKTGDPPSLKHNG